MAVDDEAEWYSETGREAFLVGKVEGVIGPELSKMLAPSLRGTSTFSREAFLLGSRTSGGGRSFELTSPISSIAWPRRVERSVMVDEFTRRG